MTGRAVIKERIGFIDMARFYAMALVFYGHFVEEIMLLKNPTGASQYKFIYSFHMVLFIVLAGYVAKERDTLWRAGHFVKHRFFTRLMPYIFFSLLMVIPPVFFDGKFYGVDLPSLEGYAKALLNTAFGLPSLCIPSWFIMMIIGVEIVHWCAFRFLKRSNTRLLIAALLFYVIGYQLNLKLDIFNALRGRTVGWNYFYIHGAITMYAFYLLGIYLRRVGWLEGKRSAGRLAPAAAAAFLVVWFTYALNTGPFNFHVYSAVVLVFASYGNMLLFPLTALAGCAMVLLLSRLIPENRTLSWLGGNTLILMCLNGLFYHFANPVLAKWVMTHLSTSPVVITAVSLMVTAASLALCIPLVWAFNAWVPQLVGKPKLKGPLFSNFVSAHPASVQKPSVIV